MGKRSSFARVERDFYPTPPEAISPLVPHLPAHFVYDEPCAGALDLVFNMFAVAGEGRSKLGRASDIAPEEWGVDAMDFRDYSPSPDAEMIITNPPWDRKILHPMIDHFAALLPTWLLFDADWAHTRQAAPFQDRLVKIVSVGRVKWIPGSKMTGKDNCAWYLFDAPRPEPAEFHGRLERLAGKGIFK